jgi:hypothetical protein
MLEALLLLTATTLAGHKTADVPPSGPTFYERVASKLAADPALAAASRSPAAQMQKLRWLIGSWRVEAHVFATATTPERTVAGTSTVTPMLDGTWLQITGDYPDGTHDLDYLGYDVVAQRWVSISLGYAGSNLVDYAGDWNEDKLEFSAHHARLLGVDVELRQIVEKRSDNEYTVRNDERLGKKWVRLDEYTFSKAK